MQHMIASNIKFTPSILKGLDQKATMKNHIAKLVQIHGILLCGSVRTSGQKQNQHVLATIGQMASGVSAGVSVNNETNEFLQ